MRYRREIHHRDGRPATLIEADTFGAFWTAIEGAGYEAVGMAPRHLRPELLSYPVIYQASGPMWGEGNPIRYEEP